ncbi:MAG: FkbM family methyltransferase [Sedimentisphaerales bacterium]|nr:FkbM family methyltransferase [Sedimentisphaerales bacterium]
MDRLDESSVCYCVGVGIDASFDFALVDRFHCFVFSFDPTPASITYMERAEYDRTKLHFLPVGLWDQDTELRLYLPTNDETLLSVYDLKGTGKYFVCKCQKLSTIMRDLGHTHIDLLKLDIEGAWHRVIRNMVMEGISISMLCVELDSPTSLVSVFRVMRMLRRLGLELVHFERDNYLFVQRHMLA